MKAHPTEQLSEYVDGALAASERQTVEAHLAACRDCAATVSELKRVVGRAQGLDDRPPTTDLWPAIADRIGVTTPRHRASRKVRRFSFTVPQLIAAAVALVIVSAAVALWLGPGAPLTTQQAPFVTPAGAGADPSSEAAVADLKRALASGQGVLDPITIRVVERNLRVIDQAIADARRALSRDPANSYLNHHLAEQMRRKLEILRWAGTLSQRS